MKIIDQVFERMDEGRDGSNEGLPMGFHRLVEYLPNIQRATYYLVGAATKCGKTSLCQDAFVYNPYDYVLAHPGKYELDIDYFTFEIEKGILLTKGICRRLYREYKILTDVNYVLSRGKNRCSQEVYDAVKTTRDYFDRLEDVVHFHDIPLNPTGINKYLYHKAERHGRIIKKPIEIRDDYGNIKKIEIFDRYVPNNKNRYHLAIIDHIGLMHTENNYGLKQNLDKMSQYLVALRNNFFITPVVIQQLSFDSESVERQRSKRLTPMLSDFSDSKYLSRDANTVLALFNPSSFGLETFNGYNIKLLGNGFRNLEILANRDGEPNINIGLHFNGKIGTFQELPRAEDMKTVDDYKPFM